MYMHYHFKQISSDITRLKDNIKDNINWFSQVVSNTVTPLTAIAAPVSNNSNKASPTPATTNTTTNNSNSNNNFTSSTSNSNSSGLTSSLFSKVLTAVKPPVGLLNRITMNTTDNEEGKIQSGEGYDENPAAKIMLGLDNSIISLPSSSSSTTTSSTSFVNIPFKREYSHISMHTLPTIALNNEDRIDYTLQESILENTTNYLAAITAHSSYFENKDVAM